jgi:hypothetical protein
MPNVQNFNGVAADTVENPEWIADDRDRPHLGALRDARSGFRSLLYTIDNVKKSLFD